MPDVLGKFKLSNPSGCRFAYGLTVGPRGGYFCTDVTGSAHKILKPSSMTAIRDIILNQSNLWSHNCALLSLVKNEINHHVTPTDLLSILNCDTREWCVEYGLYMKLLPPIQRLHVTFTQKQWYQHHLFSSHCLQLGCLLNCPCCLMVPHLKQLILLLQPSSTCLLFVLYWPKLTHHILCCIWLTTSDILPRLKLLKERCDGYTQILHPEVTHTSHLYIRLFATTMSLLATAENNHYISQSHLLSWLAIYHW